MDLAALFAGIVIVPSAIALLALRLGSDSHPAITTVPRRGRDTATPERPHAAVNAAALYPTLAMIDRGRGGNAEPLATDIHAARLEVRARELANEHWADTVWLTGLISPAQLHAVASQLEADRHALRKDVRVFVSPDSRVGPPNA